MLQTGAFDSNWNLARTSSFTAKVRPASPVNSIESFTDNQAGLDATPRPWFSIFCEAKAVYGTEYPPTIFGGAPSIVTYRPINIRVDVMIEFYNNSEQYFTEVKLNLVEWQLTKNI
jgi:hypothetical protein